jgi:hypothetical protein
VREGRREGGKGTSRNSMKLEAVSIKKHVTMQFLQQQRQHKQCETGREGWLEAV